jgi:hypothetical protein
MDADRELLDAHRPVFLFDRAERILPVNLERFARAQEIVADCSVTGTVTRPRADVALLNYFLFYMEDGGSAVLAGLIENVGAHAYDMEHLVVEIVGGVVTGVLYRPHSEREHFWIRHDDDLESILQGGRPVAYVARSKHAQYPIAGPIYRYLGMANDECRSPCHREAHLVVASPPLLKTKYVTTDVIGLPKRLAQDLSTIPEVRLSKVSTRIIWKM